MPNLFIAATAQDVGKTTTCLGLMHGLQRRFDSVGFCKPVGQRHVEVKTGVHVDKDVRLFHELFGLCDAWEEMSPVIIPKGFTRDYLDGKVDASHLKQRIVEGYSHIAERHTFTLVEGTGHAGVGSVVDLSNAAVAALLGLDVVMVAPGGVGLTIDLLSLNLNLFQSLGVKVHGVILNRVHATKREMVLEYVSKALKRWDLPLLGAIPYCDLLNAPSMHDFELLFQSKLLSGEEHRYRHFVHDRWLASSVEHYRRSIQPGELLITPASREDLITAVIEDEIDSRSRHPLGDLERGMILTGHQPPSSEILKQIQASNMPVLYAPQSGYKATSRIANFTAKILLEDRAKVQKAIHLVEHHVDFDQLLA